MRRFWTIAISIVLVGAGGALACLAYLTVVGHQMGELRVPWERVWAFGLAALVCFVGAIFLAGRALWVSRRGG